MGDGIPHDAAHAIAQPHGKEQQVKMEIVSMIHGGESPYDIIYHVAKWLERVSAEPGYAAYVEDAMRAVYGLALVHVRPMEDELRDVQARLVRIREAYGKPEFTEEEKKRMRFAIDLHEKNIERLKALIERAKVSGTPAEIVKN